MSLLRYYYDIRVGIILNIDVFELLKKNFYTPFNENIKLLRFFKNCEHHMHNNSFKIHGNSVIFLKTFLNLNFNYNISNYFFKTRQSVLTAMLLKNKNLAVFYNINAIYMEIYRLYIFFFNVGCVSGTFSTISHHVIYKDTESFNYFIQQRRGKGRWFNNKLSRMFPLQYKKRSYKPFDQTLDFLFLVDGTIEESYLSRIKKTPMHIVGLTSNITYAKYFDTVLLLESVGADLQYFFIEFALYSYLSGRRRKTLLKLSSRIGLLTFL